MTSVTPSTHPTAVKVFMALVKVLLVVCDVITFPVYFVFQQPWVYWRRKSVCYAKPVVEGDPSSPYRRLRNKSIPSMEGVKTLDELARTAIRLYSERPAVGVRPVLGHNEERQPSGKVFRKLVLGEYEWKTYQEFDEQIDLTARGLHAVGARPGQNLAILAETRVEWLLTAQACFRTNVPLVTLYVTLTNDGIVSAINETEATHLVTSADLLPRVLSVANKMPSLTHIVCMENADSKPLEQTTEGPQVVPFSSLAKRAESCELPSTPPTPEDVAMIMFTSGSTGTPKGVVFTHGGLVSDVHSFAVGCQRFGVSTCNDTYVSYLPLAHMFELIAELHLFGVGARMGFSSPLTLTDNATALARGCPGDVTLLRPTQIATVPLILDRLVKGINDAAASKGAMFKAFFDYAVAYKHFWVKRGFETPILNQLIFKKTSAILGGNVKAVACGSAPLSTQTRRYLEVCLCCPIAEGYGLTETGGAATIMDADEVRESSVGAPLPKCYIRLVDWEEGKYSVQDKPNPRGEILVGGPGLAKEYFKNEELTRELFREESGIRWFYTGDIGEIFPDGTLKIVDRKKDLVKLQYGEYVSLGRVEMVLKTCALVDNIFAYGSSLHTYLVAFVTPNYQQLLRLGMKLGKKENATLKELCEDGNVAKAAVDMILEFARSRGLQKTEVPLKIKLCPEEWMPDSGLVTPTLKLRRKPLQMHYQRDIDEMYRPAEDTRLV
nr:long-chain-fatty-acid--CoA ligase 4-like [Rhipicephalus microplus]XP_037274409.1 long-chain-fatty-acid--CoA ligase 4-like [Rhipicephalus microplus]XP_037274410.1 long-chain-fatty-acid--CoA ligase 4-like [Rhipicephalus microplus]